MGEEWGALTSLPAWCVQMYRPSQRTEHRQVCEEELVRCPICNELMKRRLIESDHNKKPEVMEQHVKILADNNASLTSVTASQAWDILKLRPLVVYPLKSALSSITDLHALHHDSDLCLHTRVLVGEDAWKTMVEEGKNPKLDRVLIGLIKVLTERRARGDPVSSDDACILEAVLTALNSIMSDAGNGVIRDNGVFEAVVKAVKAFPSSRGVQEQGLRAIRAITSDALL